MIVELRVRDLATIADVHLTFTSGLNVLTGETGAGKSMLVDALALLLGARADTGAVRPGADRIVVEGVFEPVPSAVGRQLDELGLEADEDRLVVRREVSAEGRSRAWVNGSSATVGTLALVGQLLVDLHGQHETRTLLQADRQRDVLDAFADAENEAQVVRDAAASVVRLTEEEQELSARREEIRRRADYLRHVTTEITGARLRPGEDEGLEIEARRLSQAGSLSDLARKIAAEVDGEDGSALAALARADRALGTIERADPETVAWRQLMDGAFANLQELGRLASEYGEGLQEDPGRLAEIERRRDQLYRLRQKYGETIEAVLRTGRESEAELEILDTADLDLATLATRRAAAEAVLVEAARVLTTSRAAAADRLARGVNRLLPKLGLPGGKLAVQLTPLERIGGQGAESVEFMVRLNEGMDARPLARTASGGELSRLMLAVKTVLGRHDQIPTLVFDEVDTGIGGEVGSRVGETLAEVAVRHQVLVITHLAPVAACADHHLMVAKRARGGLATSDVQVLHGEDRVGELARMLGDPEAETARRHAIAMLRDAGARR
jgi:DNA repair protein RecN (Recombination protein N)